MLEVGFPVDARGDDNGTPLDRAAVRGYADIVEVLLAHNPSLEVTNDFDGTPLGGAVWGAGNFRDQARRLSRRLLTCWRRSTLDLNRLRMRTGKTQVDRALASGREDVAAVMRRHGGLGVG